MRYQQTYGCSACLGSGQNATAELFLRTVLPILILEEGGKLREMTVADTMAVAYTYSSLA
jgi:hypothetical protein